MSYFTVEQFISDVHQYHTEDDARMCKRLKGAGQSSRYGWKQSNPIKGDECIYVIDTRLKTKPKRCVFLGQSHQGLVVYVFRFSALKGKCLECIDLKSPDASARLKRYEIVK